MCDTTPAGIFNWQATDWSSEYVVCGIHPLENACVCYLVQSSGIRQVRLAALCLGFSFEMHRYVSCTHHSFPMFRSWLFMRWQQGAVSCMTVGLVAYALPSCISGESNDSQMACYQRPST